jgi:hypothetical protein
VFLVLEVMAEAMCLCACKAISVSMILALTFTVYRTRLGSISRIHRCLLIRINNQSKECDSMKAVCLAAVLLVSISLIGGIGLADMPGASPFSDNDQDAAAFSWDGYFYSGEDKRVTVKVYDESYIHERYVEGKKQCTVTFLVFHDDPSGWGKAIQNIANEKFTGPGGYVEKAYLPLERKGENWVGQVVIIPSLSIRAISVWKQPNSGRPFFGVSLDILTEESKPSHYTVDDMRRASRLHETAWGSFIESSLSDRFYKYALYTSRILAVKHPEVYLEADGMFVEHITTQPGLAAAYKERARHAEGFYTGFDGPPFQFDQIDYSKLKTTTCSSLYPEQAPFFSFLDRRVLSVASCMKTALGIVTELEKAFIYYFDQKQKHVVTPFIIYCDNERAYLSTFEGLFSAADWSETNSIDSNPILIFNEYSVWYPMMERDDTSKNQMLRKLVEQYAKNVTTPSLNSFEQQLVNRLKTATALSSWTDKKIAAFSSVLGLSYESRLHRESARQLTWDYPGEIWRYISCYQSHLASYLSPFAAYLAGGIVTGGWDDIRELTNRWHLVYGTEHGHIWPREGAGGDLVHKPIDAMLRNRYGHCVQHAASISAVLDLAGVANYHFDTNPNGDPKGGHSFVSIPDIGCVISNGEIESELHDTLLDTGAPFEGNQIWNTLRYAASGTKWAVPYIGFYCGNWPPDELAQELTFLEKLYGDEIHGYKSDYGRGCLDVHFCKQFMDSREYIKALSTQQWNWRKFEYP